MHYLLDILLLPFHVLGMLLGRLQHWLAMRPWILLLHGSPALAAGLLLPVIGLYESQGWDRGALQLYQQLANEAVDARDQAAAGICLRKLQLLDEDGLETRYTTARMAEWTGQPQDAERLMRELAPLEGRGHPRAHFWMATRMLRESQAFSPDRAQQLVHHLSAALASDQDRQTARILLSDIERTRGNREAAARHLEAVVMDRPEMRVALSALYAQLGDVFRSRQERERAIEHFRREAGRDADNVDAVILWAEALALGGEFEQGEKAFLEALGHQQAAGTPESKQRLQTLNRRLADHYAEWSDHLAKDHRSDAKRRVELLQRALTAVPGHVGALNRLALLAGAAGDKGQPLCNQISEVLASQDIPAITRLILGTSAATRSDWGEALQQLEQAYPDMQQMPVLLNNLAWVLMSAEPPQLDKALSMAEAAANAWPQHPEIRETRGVILARLERWTDALADLEIALAAFPDRPYIHESLADTYQHLGDADMAARHRELAAQKRQKSLE